MKGIPAVPDTDVTSAHFGGFLLQRDCPEVYVSLSRNFPAVWNFTVSNQSCIPLGLTTFPQARAYIAGLKTGPEVLLKARRNLKSPDDNAQM